MVPGLNTVLDRYGRSMKVLYFESGTRCKTTEKDLASSARTLSMAELHWWAAYCRKRTLAHEARVLEAEIDRRDPQGLGPLWNWIKHE